MTQADLRRRAKMMKETMRMKLIPRLSRLLPQGETHDGKQKARNILKAAGYHGDSPKGGKWDDEARALRIFQDAGIDLSQFEHSTSHSQAVLEKLRDGTPIKIAASSHDDPAARLKRVIILLSQAERHIMEEIRSGKRREIDDVTSHLIAALNEARR